MVEKHNYPKKSENLWTVNLEFSGGRKMSFSVDFSSIRTVRVHKQQFDAIDNKANVVMLTCVEDGRVIPFNRADNEKDKIERLEGNRK